MTDNIDFGASSNDSSGDYNSASRFLLNHKGAKEEPQ